MYIAKYKWLQERESFHAGFGKSPLRGLHNVLKRNCTHYALFDKNKIVNDVITIYNTMTVQHAIL